MKNKNRVQAAAEPQPLTEAQLRLRQLRATDERLQNPAPLPPSERPKKVGLLRRTFGNHPELQTPQPTAGRAEVQPAPHQPEQARLKRITPGLGYLATGGSQNSFEARRAEVLHQAAAEAQLQRLQSPDAVLAPHHQPVVPPQGPQAPFHGPR